MFILELSGIQKLFLSLDQYWALLDGGQMIKKNKIYKF